MTPPTSDDDLLLREDWNHTRSPHARMSGALAIRDGIHVAVRDLLLAGAHPAVG